MIDLLIWLGWFGLGIASGKLLVWVLKPRHKCSWSKWQDHAIDRDLCEIMQIRLCTECNKAQTRSSW